MVGQTAARLHVPRRLRYFSMHRLGSLVMSRHGEEIPHPAPPGSQGSFPPLPGWPFLSPFELSVHFLPSWPLPCTPCWLRFLIGHTGSQAHRRTTLTSVQTVHSYAVGRLARFPFDHSPVYRSTPLMPRLSGGAECAQSAADGADLMCLSVCQSD